MAKKNSKLAKLKSKKTIFYASIIIAIAAVLIIFLSIGKFSIIGLTVADNAVAMVNGETITEQELNKQYDFLFLLAGYPEQYRQVISKESFLEQLINEKLLLQQAAKEQITITDSEVNELIDRAFEKSPIPLKEVKENLAKAGFSEAYLKDYFKKQLTIMKFINETIINTIEISEEEMQAYYDQNKEKFEAQEGQIRVRHILVETEDQAKELKKELNKGADFEQLAREYSICPSAANGGDLGFFGRGKMVSEFEDAAFVLKINEISDPIQTQFGWHIIQRLPDKMYFDESKGFIEQLLKAEKQRQSIQDYMKNLKENSNIQIMHEQESAIKIETIAKEPESEQLVEETTEIQETECAAQHNITPDTVIFYHASWCPHCTKMIPIVEELQEDGYNFYWAETSTGKGTEPITKCFSDVLQGGVPQFICAGTKEFRMGEMTKKELKEFAENCK